MDEAKALIEKYFSLWTESMGLRWWNINLIYYREPDDILRLFKSNNDVSKLVPAWVEAYWQYGVANIHINLPDFVGMTEGYIEETIVHELCHVLINEMREDELHHEERVATTLQKAFMWTRDFGRDEGMEAVK